jgi:hypothetical protein
MAERVAHAGGAGAIEHVCGWLDFFRAGLDCAPQQGPVVVQKDVESGGAAPKRPRLAVQFVVGVANHGHRSADRNLGMNILPLGRAMRNSSTAPNARL